MKYFRIGAMAVIERLGINLILIAQFAALFISANVITASYNNRYMLYEPLNFLWGKQGYFCSDNDIRRDLNPERITKVVSSLAGNPSVVQMYSAPIWFDDDAYTINAVVCDDIMMENLNLPLAQGKWTTKENDKDTLYAVVPPNKYGVGVGDIIDMSMGDKKVKIIGMLSDPTYLPSFNGYLVKMEAQYLYSKTSLENSELDGFESNSVTILMRKSEYNKVDEETKANYLASNMSFFVYYPETPSEEDYNANMTILRNEGYDILNLEDVHSRSLSYLKTGLEKYIPLVILILVVSIISLISGTALNTLQQMKNYGVFYLCGIKWKDCLKISATNIFIILIFSVLASTILLLLAFYLGLFVKWGLVFRLNNLLVTSALFVLAFIVSSIIPYNIIIKNSPVEILRGVK